MVPFRLVTSLLRILDMFAAKSDVLQEDQVKKPPTAFIKTYIHVFFAEKRQEFRFDSPKHRQLKE